MELTERQKRFLRKEAHPLKPVIAVGDKGVTPSLLEELGAALEHHELIKVRVRVSDRDTRDQLIAELLAANDATLVSRVGHIAAIYRPRRKRKPKIILPKA